MAHPHPSSQYHDILSDFSEYDMKTMAFEYSQWNQPQQYSQPSSWA